MFIKNYFKHNRITDEHYTTYKLFERYCLNGGEQHYIIINFSRLKVLATDGQKKLLESRIEELILNSGKPFGYSEFNYVDLTINRAF
jgi:hypothetical protein